MGILWRAGGRFCALNGVKKWEDYRPNAVRFEAGVLGGEMFADWNDVNITLLFASEMAIQLQMVQTLQTAEWLLGG